MLAMQISILFLVLFYAGIHKVCSYTDPNDFAVLQSLKYQWQNLPPKWGTSDDPCGAHWEGVACNNSRVTELILPSMGLEGQLSGDIGGLTELITLDLSFNKNLTGSLSPRLGDLQNLRTLILASCGFTGIIPQELGNLTELISLALNANQFTGSIPPSLGKLSKLILLDLMDNQLSGSLPISTSKSPGLDLLLKAKHFHFSKNRLSGSIPPNLFSSDMALIHIVFDQNQFSGSIPQSLGLVKNLEVLRLDRNSLTGNVPSNLNKLTHISHLNLAHNNLMGPLPNLTQMSSLCFVDLSNNPFDSSTAPDWFSSLPSLTTLNIEYGSIQGLVPQGLFSLPSIQQIKLKNNFFSEMLNMGDRISQRLKLVDLQNNSISSFTPSSGYKKTLMLHGNPVCNVDAMLHENYCQLQQQVTEPNYTSIVSCERRTCEHGEKQNPRSCECQYPFEGSLYFRGPLLVDLSNGSLFSSLEKTLSDQLNVTPGSVFIENPSFNYYDYLQMQLAIFPPSGSGKYFNRSEIQRIGSKLSHQIFLLPEEFGSFFFIATTYDFSAAEGRTSPRTGLLIGMTISCAFVVLCLIGVGIYAFKQKNRAEKAIGLSKPFASWASSIGQDSGDAPQLKVARCFSYDELKMCSNNFSIHNEIGSGGYGKVYKGIIGDGQLVAIKRAKQGSVQGAFEFKTEIELLSRIHHKNIVGFLGFCFEHGEQMLVYEFMPNGTLRDSLSGSNGIHLDWKRRLQIALGAAKGLAYLHELANPPIIHRDVKSTNILLDECLNPKVADFGLSKTIFDDENGHLFSQVKGTMGYLDPEYYTTQQLTIKSDVYSFGVVMLELITCKLPFEKGKYIVGEVLMLMNNEEHYKLWDAAIRDEMRNVSVCGCQRFLDLGLKCVEESAADRPTMSEVVKEIESILHDDQIMKKKGMLITNDIVKLCHTHEEEDMNESSSFDLSAKYALSTEIEPK